MATAAWTKELDLEFPSEAKDNPEKYRFQVELEFVQCLANPQFLNCMYKLSTSRDAVYHDLCYMLQLWLKGVTCANQNL
jgi:hypothetical protein